MKTFATMCTLALASFFIAGCPAQVPPSPPPTVSVTWTAAIPCTSCSYVVSRCTAEAAASSCPSYTPLNQTSPVSATTYTDATPPTGVSVLYVVQAVQGTTTGQPSPPSNLVPVPVYPGTPGAPNATATAELAPQLPIVGGKQNEVVALDQPTGIIVSARLTPQK